MNDSYLAHHGIKGQRWGVRRTPEQLGHRIDKEGLKNHIKRSYGTRSSETLKKARKENIDKLSNEELKKYNERLNLERNYADLTKGNIGKGKDWFAKTVVTGIVVGTISAATKAVIHAWLKKKFGINI